MSQTNKDAIGKYIGAISRRSRLYITRELSKKNIALSPNLLAVLMYLYDNGSMRQDEICCKLNLDKGNTAKEVKKLEDTGYIKREKDLKDKRVYSISLTEKGLEIREDLFSILNDLDKELGKNLTEEEYSKLLELLKKI